MVFVFIINYFILVVDKVFLATIIMIIIIFFLQQFWVYLQHFNRFICVFQPYSDQIFSYNMDMEHNCHLMKLVVDLAIWYPHLLLKFFSLIYYTWLLIWIHHDIFSILFSQLFKLPLYALSFQKMFFPYKLSYVC